MATVHMKNNIHSVHALVRLLKSSTDPPSTLGPSKIEIACLAWSDPSFGAANKGEVIGEWVLALLGQARKTRRERDAGSPTGPIADTRYWCLLCGILTTPLPSAARPTRPIKTWLLPLLHRFQLDTIVIELLALQSSQVLAPARAALATLWPLAEKKIGVDALGVCLSAVFDACTEWEHVDDDLGWLCLTVVGTYKNALVNSGNKKKLYNSFLTTHLSPWLRVICSSSSLVGSSSTKQLQDSIYAAGTDTLFSLEALKQPLGTLFTALSSPSLISSLLPVLPKLFTSFLSATHRYRSTLFVSAFSTAEGKEEIRKRGMDFAGKCWSLIWSCVGLQEDLEVEKWKSIIGVFGIVKKERLFVAYCIRGDIIATNGDYAENLALSEARDKAVEILETVDASSKDSRAKLVVLSIQLLDVLVQIEYDLIGSILERILSALINIPPPLFHLITKPASEFLISVLDYHIKTRTIHTYALALLSAAVASYASPSWTASSLSMKSTSPLAYHLPALAHALRTTLIPTQITPLAVAVLQAVENSWRAFKDAHQEEERTTKKRKVVEVAHRRRREARLAPTQARLFSYIGRVAGTILSNLPANAYTKDGEYSLEHLWADAGKLGWTIAWDCLKENTGKGGECGVANRNDHKKRKHAVETDSPSALCSHIVTSAALRFLYDIRARLLFLLGDYDRLGEAHVRTLLSIAQDEASDPELILEIVRTLIWHIWYTHNYESQTQMEARPILTVIFGILTTHPLSKSKWSGVSAALTHDNLGLAVIYVLTDRWIDVLNVLASTEDLETLISLLLRVSLDLTDEDTQDSFDETFPQREHAVITLRGTLLNLLQNAQFWELHNIRAVFLSSVLTLTAPLSCCFPITEVESPLPLTAAALAELTLASNVYKLLHDVPPEYFTRPVRAELVRRAMVGDVQICKEVEGAYRRSKGKKDIDGDTKLRGILHEETHDGVPAKELRQWSDRLTFVRVFLQRMGQLLNAPNYSTSSAFVNHLLSSPSGITFPSKALTSVTLDLIQSHIVSLLRSQEPEAAASISSVMTTLITARPFSQPDAQETWTRIIIQSSVLRLIERLTGDFDPSSLPDRVKCALRTLFEALESALLPHARRLVDRDVTKVDQLLSGERVEAWSRTLSLMRWLGMNSQVASIPFGLKLATSTIRSENPARLDSQTRLGTLGLLFEELRCMPNISHRVYLDVLIGFYAINGEDCGSEVKHIMDAHVAQASRKLSVEDFSYLLDVLAERIEVKGLSVGQRERLIRLGKVMLRDAPQGTFKVNQTFATRCFSLFADREEIYGGPPHLAVQCLEFIARHCSDRPAAVRSVDLGEIWSHLDKILFGSQEHDATTVFPIFHHVVNIISALIRLRRDLVVHTLPHLSLILRQLIMLCRKIRPQLGVKQSKIVTDTFPPWLSASQPLSTDEARALARLLTSLTTKTIPKTHAHAHLPMSTESQKAESLAKPFAKHASYVLVAYADAFNDPLCIVNAEMRRGLEPGLFALCEMVGEHNRDALMVSALDSGGKVIIKALWKEYEKQRYVGKG